MNRQLFLSLLAVLLVLSPVVAAQSSLTQSADLLVEDGHPDEQVTSFDNGNVTVYKGYGNEWELYPRNFNQSDVVDYGVDSQAGSLRYVPRTGEYVFSAQNMNGTFAVYWVTEEPVAVNETANNSTTTEVREVRYEAKLQVVENDYVYISQSEWEATNNKADNWDDHVEQLEGVYGKGVDVAQKDEAALSFHQFRRHPFKYLGDGYLAFWLLLFTSRGGFLFAISIGALWVASMGGLAAYYNRNERKKADIEDADRMMDIIELAIAKDSMQGTDLTDLFPDSLAQAWRENVGADTMYSAYHVISGGVLMPFNVLRARLEAMAQHGYVAFVERDAADEVVSARVVHEDDDPELRDDEEEVSLAVPDEDILPHLWTDEAVKSFDHSRADIDHDKLAESGKLYDPEEITEALNFQMPRDIESRKQLAEYLEDIIDHVRRSPYTLEDGSIDSTRDIINQMLRVTEKVAEGEGVPVVKYQTDLLRYLLSTLDVEQTTDEYVTDVQSGRALQKDAYTTDDD